MGWVRCLFRGHKWVEAACAVSRSGQRLRVKWCPTCQRVEWID